MSIPLFEHISEIGTIKFRELSFFLYLVELFTCNVKAIGDVTSPYGESLGVITLYFDKKTFYDNSKFSNLMKIRIDKRLARNLNILPAGTYELIQRK